MQVSRSVNKSVCKVLRLRALLFRFVVSLACVHARVERKESCLVVVLDDGKEVGAEVRRFGAFLPR